MSRSASRPALAILVPPSESKEPGGSAPNWNPGSGRFGRRLAASRRLLLDALRAVQGGDSSLLGVKGVHLERARLANAQLEGSPTLPAWRRYTGVVWDHIDVSTLPEAAMERALDSIVVVSGLLGLVAFDDPVPDYKLKMGASLPIDGAVASTSVTSFWRSTISPILDEWLQERIVLDLLPLEHRRAWSSAAHPSILRLAFVDRSGRAAGHDAKAAKGSFIRHVLTSSDNPQRVIETWKNRDFRLVVSHG